MQKIWTKLSFILCLVFLFMFFNNSLKINAKTDYKDIESSIDKFFEVRDKIENITYKNESRSLKSTGLNVKSTNDLTNFFTKDFKIKDNKLREHFINYAKFISMSYNESGLEEEIVKEKTTKKVTEKDNKIIVSVKRYIEFYAVIDGIKSDDISILSPRYDFVFDKNTGELIEYLPYDTQEMTLMKTDITKLFDSEIETRREEKRSSRENSISSSLTKNKEFKLRYNSNNALNRTNMVNYARQYANNYNPKYGDFSQLGGDCANFVSQIIKAGNAPFDNIGDYKWYYYNMNNRASAWSGVNQLYKYLINNRDVGPYGKTANSNQILHSMQIGDVVFVDFDKDGSIDHSIVITNYQAGVSNQTKVASHTYDGFNLPISRFVGDRKFVMLTGYGK